MYELCRRFVLLTCKLPRCLEAELLRAKSWLKTGISELYLKQRTEYNLLKVILQVAVTLFNCDKNILNHYKKVWL